MEKKKSVEFSFATFLIILFIIIAIVFVIARNTGRIKDKIEDIGEEIVGENVQNENNNIEIYSKNLLYSIDL